MLYSGGKAWSRHDKTSLDLLDGLNVREHLQKFVGDVCLELRVALDSLTNKDKHIVSRGLITV